MPKIDNQDEGQDQIGGSPASQGPQPDPIQRATGPPLQRIEVFDQAVGCGRHPLGLGVRDDSLARPSCGNKAAEACRGLCIKCYAEAKRMVEAGSTTWGALEQMGLVREKDSPFSRAFKQRKEG